MRRTLELLIHGDPNIQRQCEQARELWQELLRRPEATTAENFAQTVGSAQGQFDSICGNRELGKEVMAVVGVSMHYSCAVGFTPQSLASARLVRDAIGASHCSIEVKGIVQQVAEMYRLDEQ